MLLSDSYANGFVMRQITFFLFGKTNNIILTPTFIYNKIGSNSFTHRKVKQCNSRNN